MITAIVSGIFGLVSGIVPDILKEVRETRDHAREREFLMLQHKLQMERLERQAGDRIEEAEANLELEEIRANSNTMAAVIQAQSQPTNIAWIDGFNALLRPSTAAVIIILFAANVLGFSSVVPASALTPIYIEATLAVIAFLFGYRSSRKKAIL